MVGHNPQLVGHVPQCAPAWLRHCSPSLHISWCCFLSICLHNSCLRVTIRQQDNDEVHNEREDIGYELLEMNRQREQPRSLAIKFDELREPVLEYAD